MPDSASTQKGVPSRPTSSDGGGTRMVPRSPTAAQTVLLGPVALLTAERVRDVGAEYLYCHPARPAGEIRMNDAESGGSRGK